MSACSVSVKHYNKSLDSNLITLLASDPAVECFDGFKGTLAAYGHFGGAFNKNILKTALAGSTTEDNSYRLFFSGAFSEAAAVQDIQIAIEEIRDKFQSS